MLFTPHFIIIYINKYRKEGETMDDKVQYSIERRHHWWIDSGILGLYNIAKELIDRDFENDTISCCVDTHGLNFQAPTKERLKLFLDKCYEELANRYWNVSTKNQREANDLVIYEKETGQFKLIPRKSPTPIPSLFTKGSSYRANNDKYIELSPEMQKKVDAFLHDNKKNLWGDKRRLLYESPVCHPKIQIMPNKGKKSVCCVCGQKSICNEVSQPSFLLFASPTATLSFNSEGKLPDKICWECDFLSKFAVEAAHYKMLTKDKKPERLYILQMATGNVEKLINSHNVLCAQSSVRQFDEDNFLANIGTTKSGNRLLYYARLPYELLWAFLHDTYSSLRTEAEKHAQSAVELMEFCLKPVVETPLQLFLLVIGYKGQTFIVKEIINYSEAAYAYRLLHYLHDQFTDDHKLLFKVFHDMYLPKEGKSFDINNNLWRNHILKKVLHKETILQNMESLAFRKSSSEEFPYLGDMINFTRSYQIKIQEGKGMTQEQVDVAVNLGKQIVLSAKDATKESQDSNFDRIKGDLFALRKTRTPTDFLEQLNRIQFRYNIVVSNQILGGILEKVCFQDFKSYCLLAALNTFNNVKRPRENKDKQ